MITCLICTGTSPDDAKFCIECGKPISHNAYVDGTKRLSTIEVDGKTIGPYIPYGSSVEYGTQSIDKPFIHVHSTLRDKNNEALYYMYRKDIPILLRELSYSDVTKAVHALSSGEGIYYHGRRIVFMD